MTENKSKKESEIFAVYQVVVGDIAAFKSELWSVTNYSLLLQAAIVATAQLIRSISCTKFLFLILFSLAVLISSIILLCHIKENLKTARERLKYIYRLKFSKGATETLEAGKNLYSPGEKPTHLWLFNSVVVSAFIITIWILYSLYNKI